MTIRIDADACSHCGLCARVCPSDVLFQSEKQDSVEVVSPEKCIRCGHCVDVCSTGAFQHEAFPQEKIHKVRRDILPSSESVMELIRSRRSNRTIGKALIPEEHLQQIVEAARYAPTAENSRKVQYHLITDADELQKVEESVMSFFMTLARILLFPPIRFVLRPFLRDLYNEAPALLTMDEQLKQGKHPATCDATALLVITAPKNYDFGFQDCNLAYQNASLMAESLGVSQVYMGFVQTALFMMGVKKAARLLHLDKNQKVYAIMGLGIPTVRYARYVER